MTEQAKRANGGAVRKSRRLRWLFPVLIALLYISLIVSGNGVLFWIKDTTLSPEKSGPHGTFTTWRCYYFTGTRTFWLDTSMGFGDETCFVFRHAPASPPVSVVDAQAVLPDGALPRERYVRRYSLREVRIGDDTPYFTTQGVFHHVTPRRFWVAVYTLPGDLDEKQRPALIVMSEEEAMPMVFHGGCRTVNLVADPDDGQTLASWCNADDRPTADGSPRASPAFVRR
ncbi:hypothetical protein [Brevundimonas sp.]|uniref:hypothetical protein n=1 Tax=Brevundimonas sp. TaxID=1871086 RepID=UPI002ED79947